MVDQPSQTFVFADMAGFTALTETHGDERAADMVEHFCAHVGGLLGRHGGEEIKRIGDAVMLRMPDPPRALRLALDLTHHEMSRHGHPAIRAGMHAGPAVHRGGDWYGGSVNLAARVAALADPSEVLITAVIRDAADALDDVVFVDRGEVRLRNVLEPVKVFLAVCDDDAPRLVIDPVCRMALDPARSFARVRRGGREHHFCSAACRDAYRSQEQR